jgi:hypothetical protein
MSLFNFVGAHLFCKSHLHQSNVELERCYCICPDEDEQLLLNGLKLKAKG